MVTDAAAADAVRLCWGWPDAQLVAHDTGMNSRTWMVRVEGRGYVAKWVPATLADHFAAGLDAATILEEAGVPAGAPVWSSAGPTAAVDDGLLAVLAVVDGAELVGDSEADQVDIAKTLAHAHAVLRRHDFPSAPRFHRVDPSAGHLDLAGWLRPAVSAAAAAIEAIPHSALTQGLVNGDPAPEAFLRATDGTVGFIDWSSVFMGPLLYDVASAALYLGGIAAARAFVRTYVASGVVPDNEITAHLETMLEFRWAVQADYFAMRIATDDLTGLASSAGNDKGLADARHALRHHE